MNANAPAQAMTRGRYFTCVRVRVVWFWRLTLEFSRERSESAATTR